MMLSLHQQLITLHLQMSKTLFFLLIIVSFFAFFQLGNHPLQDWDESRNGINAIEMLQNKDWINLHFRGTVDDWNLKPPLSIWMIAASYSVFGLNEFALRFPAALGIIFATFFLFKIIRLYRSESFAFFTCLILVSVKGWLGFHMGRTGDMDAILLAMLMAATFFFLQYIDFKKTSRIFLSAFFFGLAFWVKGLAMAVFIPSILLYIFFSKKINTIFLQKEIYAAIGLFLIFPLGYFWINANYGILFAQKSGLGNNAFTSMFWYDIVERFGNTQFINPADLPSKLFFFSYLDTRFNMWNYFFFAGIAAVLFYFFTKKINTKQVIQKLKSPLILVSICWAAPLTIFQNFSNVQHHWYLAPTLPFIAILTYQLIFWLKKQFPYFKYLFFSALAFTLIRQISFFNAYDKEPIFIQKNKEILSSATNIINLSPHINQSLSLY
ncbi:MAG TPA: hypothetical protein ENJ53_04870, partial [Phaeodactylibacter sp.]|nr:hypothetical protein [Phaeodactylibacter sp.]